MKTKILWGICTLILSVMMVSCGPNDAKIQDEVNKELNLISMGVTGTVQKGVVTLSGVVETEAQKGEAESTLQSIKGITSIKNEIRVVPPLPKISPDQALTEVVKKSLLDAGFTDMDVVVKNGVATLTADLKKADAKKVTEIISKAGAKSVVINKPEKVKK